MLRKNRTFVALFAFALACTVSAIRAQTQQLPWEALTNREVIKMVKSKVPAEKIIAKIKISRCHFDTTNSILDELEVQGVPAEVINAMVEAPYGPPLKSRKNVETPPKERAEAAPASSRDAKLSSGTGNKPVEKSVASAPTAPPPLKPKTNVETLPVERTEAAPESSPEAKRSHGTGNTRVENSIASAATAAPPPKPKTNVETPPVKRTEPTPASSRDVKLSSETLNKPLENRVASVPTPAPPVFDVGATIPKAESLTDEISRGLTQRFSVLSTYSLITGTPAANLAQTVLAKLRATTVFNGAPNLPYGVEVIQRSDPNVFNTMGGHVFVTSGLAELLGNDAGLWAAVESHEIVHHIYRHGYRTHLRSLELQRQINYWRDRIALGDQSATRELSAAVTAGNQRNEKLEGDDENAADQLGLLMMVEAGYHPDFAINLFRILKARVGDESKVGTLFSEHPAFITRQEHIREFYPEAVARFRSLWPDAAKSPGGLPPIIATLTKFSAKEDKKNKGASLRFSYSINNARGQEIDAVFHFSLNGQPVTSVDPAFQGKNSSLAPRKRFTPTSDEESSELELLVPSSALGTQPRKLTARGCLLNKNQILECGNEFAVSFPSK